MNNSKSRKFKIISNLIGYIGVSVCLICAVAYLILHQLADPMAVGPFRWEALILLVALAIEVILVALVFRIVGIALAKKERAARVNVIKENTEVALEAISFKEEAPAPVTAPKTPAKKQNACYMKDGRLTPEGKERIVATVKKNAPVIAAVVTTAAVCTVVGVALHKHKKAKLRNSILKHLR